MFFIKINKVIEYQQDFVYVYSKYHDSNFPFVVVQAKAMAQNCLNSGTLK